MVVKYNLLPNNPQSLVQSGLKPFFTYLPGVYLQVVKIPLTRPRAGRYSKYPQTRTTSSFNAINAVVNGAVTDPAEHHF